MGRITGNGTAVTGLGGARGYGETALPRGDDSVAQVDVSAVFEQGFRIGGAHYAADQLFVSTDGLVSFGSGVAGVMEDLSTLAAPYLAIFHADVDTRADGEGAESGEIWLDVDPVADCVTITWDAVGFYRRNAGLTNTFQLQLFDRGNGGFDVVFRYQSISWTSGDLQGGWGGLGGDAALIGLGASGGQGSWLPASGQEAGQLALGQTAGNTGLAGLWAWSWRVPTEVIGTEGADTLAGTWREDAMAGLGGSDVLLGSEGADRMDGGTGMDRADYATAAAGVVIDLADLSANRGQARGDSYLSIEVFAGSAHGDVMLGDAAADVFWGREGADRLEGRNGNDLLDGGLGDDLLSGGQGDDTALGQDGQDRLDGGKGADLLEGGAGEDRLSGRGGADTLAGDAGNDSLSGGAGGDRLEGGSGADRLDGGGGHDRLEGGLGSDELRGGGGADRFIHAGGAGQGNDWIADFSAAEGDRLIFTLAGAKAGELAASLVTLPGAGRADVAEVVVTHLPTGRVIWTLVDGAAEPAILVQLGSETVDLLLA